MNFGVRHRDFVYDRQSSVAEHYFGHGLATLNDSRIETHVKCHNSKD